MPLAPRFERNRTSASLDGKEALLVAHRHRGGGEDEIAAGVGVAEDRVKARLGQLLEARELRRDLPLGRVRSPLPGAEPGALLAGGLRAHRPASLPGRRGPPGARARPCAWARSSRRAGRRRAGRSPPAKRAIAAAPSRSACRRSAGRARDRAPPGAPGRSRRRPRRRCRGRGRRAEAGTWARPGSGSPSREPERPARGASAGSGWRPATISPRSVSPRSAAIASTSSARRAAEGR